MSPQSGSIDIGAFTILARVGGGRGGGGGHVTGHVTFYCIRWVVGHVTTLAALDAPAGGVLHGRWKVNNVVFGVFVV